MWLIITIKYWAPYSYLQKCQVTTLPFGHTICKDVDVSLQLLFEVCYASDGLSHGVVCDDENWRYQYKPTDFVAQVKEPLLINQKGLKQQNLSMYIHTLPSESSYINIISR